MVPGVEAEQDAALRSGHEALSLLDAQRHELWQLQHELRGAAESLRRKSLALQTAVKDAVGRVTQSATLALEMTKEADRQCREPDPHAVLVAGEQAVSILEQRLVTLRWEEGERRRKAELLMTQEEVNEQVLIRQAEELERAAPEAAMEIRSQLPALQAEIAAAEFELMQARDRVHQTAYAPAYTEWHSMLMEDKPEHVGMAVVEEDCDAYQQLWHETLRQAAQHYAAKASIQGLDRLNRELHSVSTRAPLTSAECLEVLCSEGPWRLVFSELRDAFALLEEQRMANDELAGDLTLLRWRRAGYGQPDPSVVTKTGLFLEARQAAEICASASSGGPRFEAPIAAVKPSKASQRVQQNVESWPSLPRPVTSDPTEWQATSSVAPVRGEEAGLAFLCKNTGQRFRPGSSTLPGFESTWGMEEQPESLRRPANSEEVRDLARFAEEVFKEPLGTYLGNKTSSRYRPAQYAPTRSWPRADWVTFDNRSPGQVSATAPDSHIGLGFVAESFPGMGSCMGPESAPDALSGVGCCVGRVVPSQPTAPMGSGSLSGRE
mmetsp:Transcript_20437/g.37250  ORF Transcript_20437/g.37250 Transcript_20437/m.37250 type:complete len:550 (+) Transcript_20437:120-1769(+)